MSFGRVTKQLPTHRSPRESVVEVTTFVDETFFMRSLYGAKIIFGLYALTMNGFFLKWRVGGHKHPHRDDERHIWEPTLYLNVLLTTLSFNLFLHIFVFFCYSLRKVNIFKLYACVSYLLSGASLAVLYAIHVAYENHPRIILTSHIVQEWIAVGVLGVLDVIDLYFSL